ncbi:hypothetical protein K474DRAFT_1657195 [Panus rudis PR-1116 ss-1]|nr:hypothetical protein K474DRAFT_1657195 [Panus rudis PR-1116 ss-1]
MADFVSTAESHGLRASLGAILIGSLISVFLSGSVTMQVFLYYRLYTKDHLRFRIIVGMIWLLDVIHTIMLAVANWSYLIDHFGDNAYVDTIPWAVAVTIACTALITVCVHWFFAHRIHSLSKGNWWITGPIGLLATLRLAFALLTTTKMITIHSYQSFVQQYTWSFTTGLALSTATDILIAAALCWYLNKNRTGFSSMDKIIDSITLYTIENGLLTCVTTVISLICWIAMPHNLIFLGLHFAISKLYSNSFLATLNSRKALRGRSQASSDREMPVLFPDNRWSRNPGSRREIDPVGTKVHISVEKTIQHDVEDPSEFSSRSPTDPEDLSMKGPSGERSGSYRL